LPTVTATVIGVDVGGTKIAVATLHEGELSDPLLQPSAQTDSGALVEQLAGAIREQVAACPAPVAAVGVGVPSVIDFAAGRVRSTVNLPLSDVPLRDVLAERVGLPVFVDNDANCAALAEAHDDDGRLDVPHLVMLTVGTGVGGGIIIDGRIYRGATGAAAEFGHQLIGLALEEGVPPATHFPQPGSLEYLAAGRALDGLAARCVAEHPDSELGRLAAAGHAVAGPEVVRAAHDGDPAATAALRLLGHRLGIGVANAINIFDPEVVAIGGGVSSAGQLLVDCAREVAGRYTLPGVGTRTEVRLARSGAQAGVRGAALLATQELAAGAAELRPAETG
jgi:glucokinase